MTVVPKARATSASRVPSAERVGRIEPGRRLVGDHHQRLCSESAGECRTLALTGRQLGHTAARRALRDRPRRSPPPRRPSAARAARAQSPRSHERRGTARDRPSGRRTRPSAVAARHVPCGRGSQRHAVDEHLALVRKVEPGEEVEQRRLPGPDGPVTAVTVPAVKAASSPSIGATSPNRRVTPRATIVCVPVTQAASERRG